MQQRSTLVAQRHLVLAILCRRCFANSTANAVIRGAEMSRRPARNSSVRIGEISLGSASFGTPFFEHCLAAWLMLDSFFECLAKWPRLGKSLEKKLHRFLARETGAGI